MAAGLVSEAKPRKGGINPEGPAVGWPRTEGGPGGEGDNRGEREKAGRAELRALKEGVLAKCSVRRNWYRSLSTSLVPPWYLLGTSLVPPEGFRKLRTVAAFWNNPENIWSKFRKKSAKFWQVLQNFVKNQQNVQQFLTKKLRLENGAKECIV